MIALLLGGASSGKSELAERLAATLPAPITYVATWAGDDPAMQAKVAVHRARRPASWLTIEGGDVASVVAETGGTLLVDSLGTWVASAPGFTVDSEALCRALTSRSGDAIIVSDEVGLGVHPSSEAGRLFREALGPLNVAVAAIADRAWLVVAGQTVELVSPPKEVSR